MRRLTENLRRDGALSSAPLIYGDRIISDHHRVEAAMKAGIVEADCLSIEGEVDEGRLTAIQLSHNSLAQIHRRDDYAAAERAIGAREGDGPGTIWGRGGPVSVFSCRGETL